MTRIGLLGGTFDPIHQGHLDVADAARRALDLAQVVLIPCHIPPHRRSPAASSAHRFAMAALAAQDRPHLQLSDLEMEDASPSYTSTTLERLAARGVDLARACLITGADAFADIATWKGFPAILDRCHFVAVSRPGRSVSTLRDVLPALRARMIDAPCAWPERPSILLVDAPTAAVSSTDIRARLRAGESIAGLVPAAVAAYIEKQGLYSETPKDVA